MSLLLRITILAKLRRYNAGGQVLNNQWADVVGIIGASATRLDFTYLQEWSERLGLADLLERAFTEPQNEARDI